MEALSQADGPTGEPGAGGPIWGLLFLAKLAGPDPVGEGFTFDG